MSGDPFSDILRFTRTESVVTGGFSAGGSWAVRFPAPDKIKFFAVIKGRCWVQIDGLVEPVRFETGDVGLLTAGRAFTLASSPEVEPADAMTVFSAARGKAVHLGQGDDFAHIGGHVSLDAVSGELLAGVLPPWIHVSATSPHATAFRWMLEQLADERASGLPGSELAKAHLAQLLFIQILRAHLQTAQASPAGWLRALADPRVAPALRLMHGDPSRAWQLSELASACAMSRTTFAFHFRTITGQAPLAYLAQWRMRLAERALRESRRSIAAIGESVGYASESAFSNAFKRMVGQSPKSFRSAFAQ